VLTESRTFSVAKTNGKGSEAPGVHQKQLADEEASRQQQEIQAAKLGFLTRTGTDVDASAIFLRVRLLGFSHLVCSMCSTSSHP
jgi:hypothetical protein